MQFIFNCTLLQSLTFELVENAGESQQGGADHLRGTPKSCHHHLEVVFQGTCS